jgi:hypothetical protein
MSKEKISEVHLSLRTAVFSVYIQGLTSVCVLHDTVHIVFYNFACSLCLRGCS